VENKLPVLNDLIILLFHIFFPLGIFLFGGKKEKRNENIFKEAILPLTSHSIKPFGLKKERNICFHIFQFFFLVMKTEFKSYIKNGSGVIFQKTFFSSFL